MTTQAGSWVDIGTLTISAANGISLKHTTTLGTNSVDWRGIRVNGSMLVDHSSIGVDMSGNNNNFHDQNFGIGDGSQFWDRGANNWHLATKYV